MRKLFPVGAILIGASLGLTAGSAFAANATQKECSTKYQADKTANKLNGLSWNQYYKQCAASAKTETPAPTPAAAPAPAPAAAPAAPAAAPKPTTAKTTTAKKAPAAAAGGAVFPTAISAEFAKESPGKARMHTCLAQYNANKTANGNGGLKWIEKGGGYYSECNKKLKG